jgi:FeS assembly SUF system protein
MSDAMEDADRKPLEHAPWDEDKHLPDACAHTVDAARDYGGESSGGAAEESAIPPEELERLTNDIIGALKTVYDPEIPVDIYELGLIYKIDIDDDRKVEIEMTLTAPGCPVAGDMPAWVENAVGAVEGVSQAGVKLVFMPPWDPSRMSEEARIALNMF